MCIQGGLREGSTGQVDLQCVLEVLKLKCFLHLISIQRFILHAKKTAFVVEHDFIMATYLADRVVVFDGQPSIKTRANS